MKQSIKVAVFSAYYSPAFLGGGPIRTLSALLRQTPDGFTPHVITSDTDLGQARPLPVPRNMWTTHAGTPVYYMTVASQKHFRRAMREVRKLNPGIVYLSSFFNFRFSIVPQLLIAFGYMKPQQIALAPRGEFSNGALGLKSRKKRLYLKLHRISRMGRRIVWHASSSQEANDIRRVMGENVAIVIRENDTDLPQQALPPTAASKETVQAVFVGRVVPIKGLHILLEALKQCDVSLTLDVYGPEEDASYAQECRRRARGLPENIQVRFLGAHPNEAIRSVLRGYDLMMFPTRGENFGHVIAEALSASCPVMCADVTPWTQRILSGGGILVDDNGPNGWAHAIAKYTALSSDERTAARESARDCFNRWRQGTEGAHIFTMLVGERARKSSSAPLRSVDTPNILGRGDS